jgi:hypothetical protein
MKTKLFSFVALLVLSSLPALAQFTSSPLEPGLYEYYRSRGVSNLRLVNPKKMMIGTTTIEWISSEQYTITEEVADLSTMPMASRDTVLLRISDYNTSADAGTLFVVEGTRVMMRHYLNPKRASLPEIENAVKTVDARSEELKHDIIVPAMKEESVRFIN